MKSFFFFSINLNCFETWPHTVYSKNTGDVIPVNTVKMLINIRKIKGNVTTSMDFQIFYSGTDPKK